MTDLSRFYQTERDFHDKWASETSLEIIRPEMYFESYSAFENRYAFESLGNLAGKKILDLGCGNGEAAVYFAMKGGDVTAVDIAPLCIQNTEKLGRLHKVRVTGVCAAAEDLPFPDSTFDAIFGLGALHHFADLNRSMKEISRVLKPGGRASFIEPLSHNPAVNIYRLMAREVRTETEKPLSWAQLMGLQSYFASFEHKEFWFFSLLIFIRFFLIDRVNPSKVRYWKKVLEESARYETELKRLRNWDEKFLNRFPYFRRHCWNSVLVFRK